MASRQKISQMTPKGANLEATDLLEVSVLTGTGYGTYSITGQEIIDAASSGGGDMLKSVYDPADTGIVLSASKEMVDVINKTGSPIPEGSIVYLKSSSSSGTHPEILLADADTEATSSKTIGWVIANIANNADGYIGVSGSQHNLDTSAFADGDALWLSAATAGAMTATMPTQPNHSVFIGYVARAHPTLGRIIYLIKNGYELQELHNVLITSVANNDGLFYDSATSLWKNKTIATVLGYTAANDASVVKLTGDQTVAGIKTFSSFPVTPSSAPTTDYQVSNKKYVDGVVVSESQYAKIQAIWYHLNSF